MPGNFDEARQLWIHEIGHIDFASAVFLGLMSEMLNILRAGIEIITIRMLITSLIF